MLMQTIRAAAAGLAACAVLLSGCQSVQTTSPGAVGIERTQRMSSMVSESDMRQQAELSYRETLTKERQKGTLNADPALTSRVRAITSRLIPASAAFRPEAAKWNWEVNVIRSDQVNAWCMPGGKIAVYTGIIPVAKNDDGLAVVMGHEIAHALLRHGGERMAQQKLVQIGSIAASMSTGDMDPEQRQMVMAAIGAGTQYGVILPFSRSHESEADKVGLLLAAAACYDPREAPKLWERMAALGNQKPPEFMSTHPAEGTRINQLNEWMPEAMQVRQQFCGTTPAAP